MQFDLNNQNQPLRIRVPFLRQQMGLGDVVANAAHAVGIEQKEDCGCQQRQETLNKRVVLSPWAT